MMPPDAILSCLKGTVPQGFNMNGWRVVLDCANGATYNAAPAVFKELGATVTTIGNVPDGFNINHQCGSTHMQTLQEKVIEEQAHFGVALDVAYGDRVLFVDGAGQIVDGDELLFIIAQYRHHMGICEGVVGTQMSNLGMELLNKLDIPFKRSKVVIAM